MKGVIRASCNCGFGTLARQPGGDQTATSRQVVFPDNSRCFPKVKIRPFPDKVNTGGVLSKKPCGRFRSPGFGNFFLRSHSVCSRASACEPSDLYWAGQDRRVKTPGLSPPASSGCNTLTVLTVWLRCYSRAARLPPRQGALRIQFLLSALKISRRDRRMLELRKLR